MTLTQSIFNRIEATREGCFFILYMLEFAIIRLSYQSLLEGKLCYVISEPSSSKYTSDGKFASFLFGMWFKDQRKNAYWRVYGLLPLCVMTAILPFLPSNALIELPIIAFSAGIMMKTFTGSQIENHPFVIFMTSGNYRRMLTALYYAIQGSGDQREYRRQAVNYSFIVGSFVVGAIVSAVLMHFVHLKSIWVITLSLITIMVYYSSEVKRLGLKETNL